MITYNLQFTWYSLSLGDTPLPRIGLGHAAVWATFYAQQVDPKAAESAQLSGRGALSRSLPPTDRRRTGHLPSCWPGGGTDGDL